MWHTVSRAMFNHYVAQGLDRRYLMVVSSLVNDFETCAAMEMRPPNLPEQSFHLVETEIPGIFKKVKHV